VLALALPSAAHAQSAGDEQYTDPFSNQGDNGSQQQPSNSGSQGGGGQGSAPTTAQGQTTAPGASAAPAQPAQTGTLPRTGGQAPLLFAYGWVLLVTGTTLRRLARRTS
jgi:hypothetical protein